MASAAPSGLPAQIDEAAVSILVDEDIHHPLGTGFYFMRSNYFVTAKHVVAEPDTGTIRSNLVLMQRGPDYPKASVRFMHPSADLAVLEIDRPACQTPLFPSHERLIGQHGLRYWGYAPTISDLTSHRYLVRVVDIPKYEIEAEKERDDGPERVLRFDSSFAEAGHSGGPVLGIGGGVLAVIVEGGPGWLRATEIHALLPYIHFCFPTEPSEGALGGAG